MNRSFSRFVLAAVVTAAVAAVVVPTAAANPEDHPWVGTGTGTTTVVSDGATGPAVFTYSATGFAGSWNFSTVAKKPGDDEDDDTDEPDDDETSSSSSERPSASSSARSADDDDDDEESDVNARTVQLAWTYAGFHSFFQVTVGLDAFVTHGATTTTTPLVNDGPVDCCTPPSGGFTYSGTVSLSVQPGDTYGFAMRGTNFDSARALSGTLTVDAPPPPTDDPAQPVDDRTPAATQQSIRQACTVPKLKGKTTRRAKILLRNANCALGRITKEKVGKKARPGHVLRSKPRAGRHLSRGAKVAVVVGLR